MLNLNKSTESVLQKVKGLPVWCWIPSTKIGHDPLQQILQFINNNTPHSQLSSFPKTFGIQIPNWRLMI